MIKQEINSYKKPYWISSKTIDHTIPLHWHTYYEIEIVTSGVGHHICNSIENELEQGIVFLLSPQDFHQLEFPNNSKANINSLCFQEDLLTPEIKMLLKNNPPPYVVKLSGSSYDNMLHYFEELNHIIEQRTDTKDLLAIRIIEIIIIKLSEQSQLHQSIYTQSSSKLKSLLELQPIITYINTHYDEPLDRDNLAKIVHLSPSYLSNIFKKTFGVSLTDYIINCRMKNAKALLKHGNESVKNAMEKVGYNSASLFYRHFYKFYGIKPSDIQKKS